MTGPKITCNLIVNAFTPIWTTRMFAAEKSLDRTMYLWFTVLKPGIFDTERN